MAKARRFEVKVFEITNYVLPRGVQEVDFEVEVYCGAVMRKARPARRKSPLFETAFQFDVTTQAHIDVFVYYKSSETEELLGVLDCPLEDTEGEDVLLPLYNVQDTVGELRLALKEVPEEELSIG